MPYALRAWISLLRSVLATGDSFKRFFLVSCPLFFHEGFLLLVDEDGQEEEEQIEVRGIALEPELALEHHEDLLRGCGGKQFLYCLVRAEVQNHIGLFRDGTVSP